MGSLGSDSVPLYVCLLGLWYCQGLLWPSVYVVRDMAWSAVCTGSVNSPLTPAHPLVQGTCDIAGCVQNISQNQ